MIALAVALLALGEPAGIGRLGGNIDWQATIAMNLGKPGINGKNHTSVSITDLMQQYGIKGLSMAVIQNYQVVFTGAYGVVSGASGAGPVTAGTLFQAGSLSKPVAAYGMLTLVQAGKADLTKPINAQLGHAWKLPDPKGLISDGHRPTLRRLMMHYAGTGVHGYNGHRPDQTAVSLVDLLNGNGPEHAGAVVIERAPGTFYVYSGGGIEVMQLLMSQVAGQGFSDYMAASVLAPLGMSHSTFAQPLPQNLRAQAAGSSGASQSPPWNAYDPELAAAGLWTTPQDYAQFIIALAHEGQGSYPLNHTLTKEMITGTSMPTPGGGWVSWGLGVEARQSAEPGVIRFEHDGNNLGFTTAFIGFTNGQGVVVMANKSDVNDACFAVEGAVGRMLGFPKG